ncbi:MAG: NAD-dependent epimerase/dehydratase family protein [Dehalococcoidia bacterium]|nr:NAD-dependent epimerase/dehydratase family protein [Dehalococcoidia bacterium]
MRALVTGASGFIGSHIVERLVAAGDSVRAFVRPTSDVSFLRALGVELAQGDITDPASLPPAMDGIEAVYHAAAAVTDWGPWRLFRSVTIEGTRNVLEAAARAGVGRFLHISTDGVYAHSHLGKPMTEETPLETRFAWWDYYRRSKLAAERLAWQYHAEGRLAVTAVRPGIVLGERDRVTVPGLAAYMRGKGAVCWGNGHNRLPCVYAGDVAAACLLAVASPQAAGQPYNVVSDEPVTQRDLLQAIAEAAGLAAPRRSLPLPLVYAAALAMEVASVATGRRWEPPLRRMPVTMLAAEYLEDASKAQRELGWQPAVPMREAVRRCVEWRLAARRQEVAG